VGVEEEELELEANDTEEEGTEGRTEEEGGTDTSCCGPCPLEWGVTGVHEEEGEEEQEAETGRVL